MSSQVAASRNVRVTVFFVAAAVLLGTAAAIIGLGPNSAAIPLWMGASACAVLAVAHPWRQPRRWLMLGIGSLLVGLLAAIVHNFAEGGATYLPEASFLAGLLRVVGVTLFLAAILVAPAAIVVGFVGSIVAALRLRLSPASR